MKYVWLFLMGCASNGLELPRYKKHYRLTDKSGQFVLEREVGFAEDKYVTKYQIVREGSGQPLERSVVLSTLGRLSKKWQVIRPRLFQYQVWLDRQKHSVKGALDAKNGGVDLTLQNPRSRNRKHLKVPDGQVFCFFSQVIECAATTGFLTKAKSLKTGRMKLHVLFEGYPYFQEHYRHAPEGLFSEARLIYDGLTERGEMRLSLKFGKTTVLYFVNDKWEMVKMFWPSEGVSLVARDG